MADSEENGRVGAQEEEHADKRFPSDCDAEGPTEQKPISSPVEPLREEPPVLPFERLPIGLVPRGEEEALNEIRESTTDHLRDIETTMVSTVDGARDAADANAAAAFREKKAPIGGCRYGHAGTTDKGTLMSIDSETTVDVTPDWIRGDKLGVKRPWKQSVRSVGGYAAQPRDERSKVEVAAPPRKEKYRVIKLGGASTKNSVRAAATPSHLPLPHTPFPGDKRPACTKDDEDSAQDVPVDRRGK